MQIICICNCFCYYLPMNATEQAFEAYLRKRGERISSPRLQIFRALLRKGPIPITELAGMMSRNGINSSTTYRTMSLFRKLDVIHDFVAGGRKLVELSQEYVGHHHHLWCASCGKLIDFDDAMLETVLAGLARDRGFTITSHQIDITGTCGECQGQTA